MLKGTLPFNELPSKKQLYGNESFHLTPHKATNSKDQFFVVRPSTTKGFTYQIEGIVGMGDANYRYKELQINKGVIKNAKYLYYTRDVAKMSSKQQEAIKEWAVDGRV